LEIIYVSNADINTLGRQDHASAAFFGVYGDQHPALIDSPEPTETCRMVLLHPLFLMPVFIVATLLALTSQSSAHPHVWVKAQSEVLFHADGSVAGLRHHWQFDEAYSSYAVQGLPTEKDGRVTSQTLAPLAQENTLSLQEFGYFSRLRIDGKVQAFATPTDYSMDYDKGILSLHFTLPLKNPAKLVRSTAFELYDPTYFVSFTFIEGDKAVSLSGGPSGCLVNLTRPKTDLAAGQSLSENVFSQLSAQVDFNTQFLNRALIACP
jgi:ABC-type uncharacterized transport system substrate-binding protein